MTRATSHAAGTVEACASTIVRTSGKKLVGLPFVPHEWASVHTVSQGMQAPLGILACLPVAEAAWANFQMSCLQGLQHAQHILG